MGGDPQLLILAAALVLVAGVLAAAEAALSTFSKSRAEGLAEAGRRGAERVRMIVADSARYLNTALFLRLACELIATILVADVFFGWIETTWLAILAAAGVMIVVSYVVVGVAPRTIGRQQADRVALLTSGLLMGLTRVLGPLPKLLIWLGNLLTPGKGFREGPFATEAELRELVDIAEASRVIESGERQMIHSVFDLGDTIVREVMVPRTDIVVIERHKTLRQLMSLALRSGFSRIPVIGENLDDIVGVAYLKDVTQRIYDNRAAETTERVEQVMRPPAFVPDSKPIDALLREMQQQRTHLAIVLDEYGGTAGLVTIEDILEEIVGEITDEYDVAPQAVERLGSGAVRVSSRLPIHELGEVFNIDLDDEDVDSVGGLMAKYLDKVPIPGAKVTVDGLQLVAEGPVGRRNRIPTILVTRIDTPEDGEVPSTEERK
ncbi:hemolysin family protein [Thermasporomyces composti]|jgi:CBS domain containing-hemolysin-like protein|uniref:CBS domain containing-hemolysin-like protein n=1 Tax=Thermasporomyces composti TaxID=696763 RepID=A0A3D9VF74_THECX|nr:hemolysin family protein [Thermasporomyces composti]REF37795.1 CBS domain containing-hemolysin-like protein [Thermasporomyces composti]